jgi:hypothetical protein
MISCNSALINSLTESKNGLVLPPDFVPEPARAYASNDQMYQYPRLYRNSDDWKLLLDVYIAFWSSDSHSYSDSVLNMDLPFINFEILLQFVRQAVIELQVPLLEELLLNLLRWLKSLYKSVLLLNNFEQEPRRELIGLVNSLSKYSSRSNAYSKPKTTRHASSSTWKARRAVQVLWRLFATVHPKRSNNSTWSKVSLPLAIWIWTIIVAKCTRWKCQRNYLDYVLRSSRTAAWSRRFFPKRDKDFLS